MTNSRAKGARGELMVCEGLRPWFPDIRRTAQHSGVGGQIGDVEAPDSLPHLHIEVKHGNAVSCGGGGALGLGCAGLTAALDQAARDCPAGSFPVVVWRNTATKGVRYPGVNTWKMTWRCPAWGHAVTVAGWDAIAATMERLNKQTGG